MFSRKSDELSTVRFVTTVVFLTSVMTFPRSFLLLKLICFALFVASNLLDPLRVRHIKLYPAILLFYCLVGIGGVIWSIIGVINGGETAGIIDNLRLYLLWSVAYVIIVTLLRNDDGLRSLHIAIGLSAILITLINVFGLYDSYASAGYISLEVREELDMFAGFGDGYIKISSQNIGSLLFIIPYLVAARFRRDMQLINPLLTKVALVLALFMAVISGRRALWLCVGLTPAIIALVVVLSGGLKDFKRRSRIFFAFLVCLAGAMVCAAFFLWNSLSDSASVDYMNSAFSAEDERMIQRDYLVATFMDYPILGSGFGVYAGYLRNSERPWIYELTYYQMLFNFGVVGILYWLALAASYMHLALRTIRQKTAESGAAFCMVVGLVAFLIGAYSNPYLGSFDFLLYIAVLPYMASYASGFTWHSRGRVALLGSRSTIVGMGAPVEK